MSEFGEQQVETMAIAVCYAGFIGGDNRRTPLGGAILGLAAIAAIFALELWLFFS